MLPSGTIAVMRPIYLSLWAMLALLIFIPGVGPMAPGAFNYLVLLFGMAAALPAMAGLRSILVVPPWPRGVDFKIPFRLGYVVLALNAVALARSWVASDSPHIRAACGAMLLYLAMIVVTVAVVRVLSGRIRVRFDFFSATLTLLAIYCIANLMLWAAGVRSPFFSPVADGEASIMASIGIQMNRAQFPLSWGVNAFSVVSGAALTMGIAMAGKTRRIRDFAVFVVPPFLCVLLSDSRGSLMCALLAAIGVLLAPRWSLRALVLFLVVGAFVIGFADSIPQLVSFGRGSSDSTFTNREIIWGAGLVALAKFEPLQLVGYGQFGQFDSGAWMLYELLFKGVSDTPELMTLHNAYLQLVMDIGYVGFAATMAFVLYACSALRRLAQATGDWRYIAAFAGLAFLIVNGLTEVTLSFYQPWIAVLMLAIVGLLRQRVPAELLAQPLYHAAFPLPGHTPQTAQRAAR